MNGQAAGAERALLGFSAAGSDGRGDSFELPEGRCGFERAKPGEQHDSGSGPKGIAAVIAGCFDPGGRIEQACLLRQEVGRSEGEPRGVGGLARRSRVDREQRGKNRGADGGAATRNVGIGGVFGPHPAAVAAEGSSVLSNQRKHGADEGHAAGQTSLHTDTGEAGGPRAAHELQEHGL